MLPLPLKDPPNAMRGVRLLPGREKSRRDDRTATSEIKATTYINQRLVRPLDTITA